MAQLIQSEGRDMAEPAACSSHPGSAHGVVWLQGITLAWMLAECGVSLYGAISAHSPALLSFGADSFIELLSATVVLLAILPSFPLTRDGAARLAGILLFVLAGVVALVTVLSLLYRVRPEVSCSGIAITFAALIVMPILAWAKRRTAQRTNNRALAADAVQSATCAYLAAITLAGLAINAVWHIGWVDSTAALLALPILIVEGRRALRGESCGCC
ncbi:divalent metal cation (Fe/Co/Zn/Cd) transporter [Silvibacterium bohemicum]|uniref:Divalent metal cation (Fe/Co/Zn/Cd) transporter n=1 Tax=Silvibacterium bohemicum TaxID=1577686 RepID=A0A841JT35_9BACT|nr:cation transporter [Silvibacterium bohemicum]MBB6144320.1 divalent metal cation (Fe/Co/Zn/Cd) transporter [Silvibacterium bohemicum]